MPPVVAPATLEYVPAEQGTHTLVDMAPITAEKVPAGQEAHTPAPGRDVNVPAEQLEHVLTPAVENVPALQFAQDEPMTLSGDTLEIVPLGSNTLRDSA